MPLPGPGALCAALHLNINYGAQGKSEVYFLATGSPPLPGNYMTQALQIAYGRTAFFGAGATLVNARVSSTDSTHDGARCALPYPLGPHPAAMAPTPLPTALQFGPINEPNDCIQMRFETRPAALFWQRYYNFINDSWITNNALSSPALLPYFTPLAGGAPFDMSPGSGASFLQICQSFWTYLIQNTSGAQKVSKGYYNLLQPAVVVFAQVTSKKVGRAFDVPRGRRTKATVL